MNELLHKLTEAISEAGQVREYLKHDAPLDIRSHMSNVLADLAAMRIIIEDQLEEASDGSHG